MRHTQKAVYNKRPVIVAMGWDVPLQGYFMTVEPVEEDNPDADDETGMIYSNLDDKEVPGRNGMAPDIEHFKKRLLQMQIEVPPEFFGKVLAD